MNDQILVPTLSLSSLYLLTNSLSYLLINSLSLTEANNSSSWLAAFPRLHMATVYYQADYTLPVIMMEVLQHLFTVTNYYILYVFI